MPTVEIVKASEVRPWDMLDEGVFVRQLEIGVAVTVEVGACRFVCIGNEKQCLVGPEWGDSEFRALSGLVTVARGLPARISGCQKLEGCVRP